MYVARWILAAIVVILFFVIVWVEREKRLLVAALAEWAVPLAPECAKHLAASACAALAAPLGPPPAWAPPAGGTPPGAPAADLAIALAYSVALVAQTTSATLGYGKWPTVAGAAALTAVSAPAVDPQPFALVWAGAKLPWVVVAFRGTATAADFIADSHYGLASPTAAIGVSLANVIGPAAAAMTSTELAGRPALPGGGAPTIHSGFAATYADLRTSLMRAVAAAPVTVPVFIAGHSLGAALAFLAAAEIAAQYPGRAVFVVGVAPPRVGNAAFTEWLAARPGVAVASLINIADLVPSLPWSYMPVLEGAPAAFAHIEPIVMISSVWPDAIGCHASPAYAAGISGASILAPAILQAPTQ